MHNNNMSNARYRSGELIQKGDRVRIGDRETVVAFVMTRDSAGWDECWNSVGEGVMLHNGHPSGLYVRLDEPALLFLSRGRSAQ